MKADGTDRYFELADMLREGRRLAVRDDQHDFESFLDAARVARGNLSVIDTGKFGLNELELLLKLGTNLYLAEEVRTDRDEFELFFRAAKKSGAFLAMFVNKRLASMKQDGGPDLDGLLYLAESGVDIHVSDAGQVHDFAILERLASACRRGRGYFVFHYYGELVEDLLPLAGKRIWLHFTDRSIDSEEAAGLAWLTARTCRQAGSRAVIHITRGLSLDLLKRLFGAGAHLNFLTPPSEPDSVQGKLEERAGRRKIPARAYYLTLSFMP